ncbi:MAG: hypothetical protein C4329_07335, partial [Chitinophagaceae bacterium]
MKRIVLAAIALSLGFASTAQDSTATEKVDTIKVGGITIMRSRDANKKTIISNESKRPKSNISTNWGIIDIGFTNYNDNTNYASAGAQAFAPGINNSDALKLRAGKSVNVNLWFFMQKLNVAKHVVNLKYGLGLELNNYHFSNTQVDFSKNPTMVTINPFLTDKLKKNKLAADYLTVPAMLNFNFTPNRKRGFGFSAGASVGYLYSARQKFKYNDGKKEKEHDDFDLNRWKVSYIGELSLGVIR